MMLVVSVRTRVGVWIATEAREAGPSRTRSQQGQKARRKWTEEKGSRVDKNVALPLGSMEEGEEGWMEGKRRVAGATVLCVRLQDEGEESAWGRVDGWKN